MPSTPKKKPARKPAKKPAAKRQQMTFDEWMALGIKHGWCGAPVCSTHDGIPMSEEEETAFFEEGEDRCVHIVRMYESLEVRDEVEKHHGPSRWRNNFIT